jgi:hypothetical protein
MAPAPATAPAPAYTFVSDDDSTTRSNLQHSTEEMIKAKLIPEYKIKEKGRKVQAFPKSKDKGKLPLDVKPPQELLADPSTRSDVPW